MLYLLFMLFISGRILHDAADLEEPLEDSFSAAAERSPDSAQPVNSTTANGHTAKRKIVGTSGKYEKYIFVFVKQFKQGGL